MTEELIKFETAVLVKEKGFDEQTRNAFDANGGEVFSDLCSDSVKLVGLGNRQGHKWWNSKEIGKYARPTQSLLQRWLREVHDCAIEVKRINEVNTQTMFYKWTIVRTAIKDGLFFGNISFVNFNSYEEALEDALVKALNLI